MNLHTPERGESESYSAYKARRAASNVANRAAMRNPNHGLVGSREQYRADMRKSGAMGKRTRASDALMAAWAAKRITKARRRDEHGAYTLIGSAYTMEGEGVRPTSREHVLGGVFCGPDVQEHSEYTARRKWLAGISAQRGY